MAKKLKSIKELKAYYKECYAYTVKITFLRNVIGGCNAEYNIRFYTDPVINKDSDRMYKQLTKLIKKDKSIYNYNEEIITEDLKDEE